MHEEGLSRGAQFHGQLCFFPVEMDLNLMIVIRVALGTYVFIG
jgi:hypothetical protein